MPGRPRSHVSPSFRGLAVFLAGASLFALSGCSAGASRGESRDALAVHRGTFQPRSLLTGQLVAERSDPLGVPRTSEFQLQIRWLAEDGAAVKAGQPVVEFDNSRFASEIEEKRLGAAEAANQLALKRSEGDTSGVEKDFDVEKSRAELEKARTAAAIPKDLLSLRDYQERQLALKRAESALTRAQREGTAQKKTAASDVAVQKIVLEKASREIETAESAIEALTLRAPRDGLVLIGDHPWEGRRLQIGDTVWIGMQVASLPDLSSMRVAAELSDVDDGTISVGLPVVCYLDAYPEIPFTGRITDISPVARESRRSQLLRNFPVTVVLDRPDRERMRPGMSVRVEVLRGERKGVLLAPRAGLDFGGAAPTARLRDGGSAKVKLGPCSAQECVVESGLQEGARLRELALE